MAGVNGVNGAKTPNGTSTAWQSKHDLADHFIGGNKLSNATPSKVKDFVQTSDGHSVITNVSSHISEQYCKRLTVYRS